MERLKTSVGTTEFYLFAKKSCAFVFALYALEIKFSVRVKTNEDYITIQLLEKEARDAYEAYVRTEAFSEFLSSIEA